MQQRLFNSMEAKVAGCCLQWNHQQPALTPRKVAVSAAGDFVLSCSFAAMNKLTRRRSIEIFNGERKGKILRKTISASLRSFTNHNREEYDDFDEEEFVRLEALTSKLQESKSSETLSDSAGSGQESESSSSTSSFSGISQPPWPAVQPEPPPPPPTWPDRDEIVPASVGIRANSVDLPLSLRILKRKKRTASGLILAAGESACCSVKKAFSSMVFIVRELQSYSLQMREVLFYANLKGILARVQDELNTSFVWLFQQIFSSTPTLMLYLMLLLANFTVHSISQPPIAVAVEIQQVQVKQSLDESSLSSMKSFLDGSGRTSMIGGGSSGGGTARPVAGATDDGKSGSSSSSYLSSSVVADQDLGEDAVWKKVVEEASSLQASLRGEALMDRETLRMLVAPVTVEVEEDGDYWEYKQRELMYHQALSQDPDNVLILSNLAQFLFLVLRDHDRAEYYFKRAVSKPGDAEALDRYANFLWVARNDLGAAEETYLEAIAADPSNPYYAANYAHFLWNTGGEDTCYPPLGGGSDAC